jgi:hypothetical protein
VTLPPITTTTNGVSIAFWFKIYPGSNVNVRFIYFSSTTNNDTNAIFLYYGGDTYLYAYLNDARSGTSNRLIKTTVNDAVWRHCVWTISTSGEWIMYINGAMVQYYTGMNYPLPYTRYFNTLMNL